MANYYYYYQYLKAHPVKGEYAKFLYGMLVEAGDSRGPQSIPLKWLDRLGAIE